MDIEGAARDMKAWCEMVDDLQFIGGWIKSRRKLIFRLTVSVSRWTAFNFLIMLTALSAFVTTKRLAFWRSYKREISSVAKAPSSAVRFTLDATSLFSVATFSRTAITFNVLRDSNSKINYKFKNKLKLSWPQGWI